MIAFFTAGAVLGLSAGFSPGPLMTLVISQTFRHGMREGVKVAFAPLVTDFPIILVSTMILARVANYRPVLGAISLAGGLFVLHLAWETFRTTGIEVADCEAEPKSLRTGALVNALSPHPYLFWMTVGAPMLVKAWASAPPAAGGFVAGFLGCLIGAKVFVAALAARSRQALRGKGFGYLMRVLGLLLLGFAVLLVGDGARLLGVIR